MSGEAPREAGPPDGGSLEELALAYVMWTHFQEQRDFWAVEAVLGLSFRRDWDNLFEVALELVRQAGEGDDWALAAIGAGPLEELLAHGGEEWLPRVEAEALRNRAFAEALASVWPHDGMAEAVHARIRAAAAAGTANARG